MACVEPKAKRPRRGARYQMELKFPTEDAKTSFLQRLSAARSVLTPQGAPQLDQRELLEALLSLVEERGCVPNTPAQPVVQYSSAARSRGRASTTSSILENAG